MIPLLVAGQLDLQAQILDVQVLGPPLLFQGPLLFSVALYQLRAHHRLQQFTVFGYLD